MRHALLPSTLEAVLDHNWLGEVLDDVESDECIVAIEQIDSTKTLAQKVRFRATIENSDGRRRTKSYCVKAHLDGSPGNDLFSEARFYRELGPLLSVRRPAAYFTAVDENTAQAMIIMDDVVDMGGQFLSSAQPLLSGNHTRFVESAGSASRLDLELWSNLTPGVAVATHPPHD